jgi:hypothetical protein
MKQMSFRLLLSLLAVMLFAACSPAGNHTTGDHEDATHTDGHTDTGDHAGDVEGHGHRVPNNGAVVRIIAPTSGDTFARGEEVIVEIETEQFPLGEDGNHWHVYVNGESWGMVMGANYTEVLRGLTPGQHQISVYLSNAAHEDLEDGDAVTITVTE